jgi:proteasome lid subunit RPN8/RPN11
MEKSGSHKLIIARDLFSSTMSGLREQSANCRESGAIWAGQVVGDSWIATKVFFHHELGNDRSGAQFLELSEAVKFQLYETLAGQGLRLIALIHTHPAGWVDLSGLDQQNQLGSRVGFWSLVSPFYGRRPWWLCRMGIHERLEVGWHRLSAKEIRRRVHFGRA